jgi:hypothetical protein
MAIEIICPGCQKVGQVPDQFAGRQLKCRVCETRFPVPSPGAGGGDEGLPPGLEGPVEEPDVSRETVSIPLASQEPAKTPPPAPEVRAKSPRTAPVPEARRPIEKKRMPNFLRRSLSGLFRLLLLAMILGYVYGLFLFPMVREGVNLYAGLGAFAFVVLLYLVIVRVFYRAYTGAIPDRPR